MCNERKENEHDILTNAKSKPNVKALELKASSIQLMTDMLALMRTTTAAIPCQRHPFCQCHETFHVLCQSIRDTAVCLRKMNEAAAQCQATTMTPMASDKLPSDNGHPTPVTSPQLNAIPNSFLDLDDLEWPSNQTTFFMDQDDFFDVL